MRGVDRSVAMDEHHQAERSFAALRHGEDGLQRFGDSRDGHPLFADVVGVLVGHPATCCHENEQHGEQCARRISNKHDTIVYEMNDSSIREIPTRVLVESMLRADGTIDAGELYSVGNALGMSDQQVRLCIRRAVADGQLVQDGRGRRALLRATDAMRKMFEPDVEFVRFAYNQDSGRAPWDGIWHVVAFAIPESSRPARDAMRAGILRLGGAPIQGGLYVSANAWEPHVAKLAADLGVEQHLSTLTTSDPRIGDLHAPAKIAAHLWPLDDVADRYRRLRHVAAKRRAQLSGRRALSRIDHLTIALELALEFTEAMEPDPLLPPDLLPRPWIGAQARNAFAQCWSRLSALTDETVPQLFQTYTDAVLVVG